MDDAGHLERPGQKEFGVREAAHRPVNLRQALQIQDQAGAVLDGGLFIDFY